MIKLFVILAFRMMIKLFVILDFRMMINRNVYQRFENQRHHHML